MMQPLPDPGHPPSSEQLAAYVDGELDAPVRAAVEAWLAGHPEAEAEVETQRQLSQLWQTAIPPEPSEAEWAAVLARIDERARAQREQPRRSGPRRFWAALMALTAAAAVLLALSWYGWHERPRPSSPAPDAPAPVAAVQPLPVVSADEVEIISLYDADSVALVVGDPPLRGPMVVVSVGDVTLENDGHGMEPWSGTPDDPSSPMILAPQTARTQPENNR